MAAENKEVGVDPWAILPSWRLSPKYSSLSKGISEGDDKQEVTNHLRTVSTTSLSSPSGPDETHEEGKEWIRGALLCTRGAGIILALNFIMAIVATGISYSKPLNRQQFQAITLYDGDCSVSSRWATGLHLLINVLSTLLLATSNYVMQCLGAPSRSDINQAHKKRKWLDVGTFSVRNFAIMDTRRKILWVLLLLSSTPIHMIYNSVVFSSISTLEYATVVVPDDLTASEPLVADESASDSFTATVGMSPMDVRAEIFNGTYNNMTIQDCLNKYNIEYNTHLGTLLFTADRQYLRNTSSLFGVIGDSLFSVPLLYDYFDSLEQYEGESVVHQIMNSGNLTVHGLHWAYHPWNFTMPFPTSMTNVSSALNVSYFTLNTTVHMYDKAKDVDEDIAHDLGELYEYLTAYNPDGQALATYLKTPSHWASSWAGNITFEQGNRPVFPSTLYIANVTSLTRVPISGCMSKDKEQRCQLFYSPPIAIAVIVSNVIKVVCMYLTARSSRKDIFLTVGDAISSFLTHPDPNTEGRCLMSRADVTHGPQSWAAVTLLSNLGRFKGYRLHRSAVSVAGTPLVDVPQGSDSLPRDYPTMLPERKRWFQAASVWRWTATLGFLLCCVATSIFLFCLSIAGSNIYGSIPRAWDIGFGKATAQTMIQDRNISNTVISLVLLTNTPQMILSILYFLCNSLMTCMLIAAEYDDYATQRKPLRVSWPKGQQRSTYYLSLPYRYGAPLLLFSVIMHWLLSQSIFFVNIQAYDVRDQPDPSKSTRGCGYSPIAIFCGLLVSGVAIIALLGLSCRRLKSRMPLATHCSAAISAACHPPPDDHDAALKPVMWGEVVGHRLDEQDPRGSTAYFGAGPDSSIKYAHCTFTSQEVNAPNPVRLYR
ncbi:hypothetical protein BDV23DRAFT_180994 [Aspergillus alliaceus]|uniref:DUF6536 domain-containing protein n=1 Tax=Petromyces alliaceus TaxID=209559 RepID=A0A5N7CGB4_PETAA|nr:hypothetical protein BDV23DRAFT_180994 [Aspergillus alliaceus]